VERRGEDIQQGEFYFFLEGRADIFEVWVDCFRSIPLCACSFLVFIQRSGVRRETYRREKSIFLSQWEGRETEGAVASPAETVFFFETEGEGSRRRRLADATARFFFFFFERMNGKERRTSIFGFWVDVFPPLPLCFVFLVFIFKRVGDWSETSFFVQFFFF
jgi:hypothetical protein